MKPKKIFIYLFIYLLLISLGCATDITKIHSNYENQDGNFILYVSNQSPEIPTVDIFIKIDDVPVLHKFFKAYKFNRPPGHNPQEFRFQFNPGKHRIYAETQKGKTKIDETFEIKNKNWAVIDFWYNKKQGNKYNSPTFTFEISNKPIMFL